LKGRVDFTSVYSVAETIDVSSGIGPFNVSQAFDYDPNTLSFYFATVFEFLLIDSTIGFRLNNPTCAGQGCMSFYFPGSFNTINPSPGTLFDQSPVADVVLVHGVQGMRIDFWATSVDEAQSVNASDLNYCPVYGGGDQAFALCVAPSTFNVDHLIACMSHSLSN